MFACILVACCFLMFFVFVCVCMCLCLFRFVGWLFFSSFVGLFVRFSLVIGLVSFVYWFGLVCLFVWIACWLLGFVVVPAVRAIAGGFLFSAFT